MYEYLLGFGLILWLTVSAVYVRMPCASLFHPATYYIIFHGIVFVIRPIFAWYYDYISLYYAYQFWPSDETKLTVLTGADLGFVVFMIFVLYWGRAPLNFELPETKGVSAKNLKSAFLVMAALCLPIALASTMSYIEDKALDAGTMIRDFATGYSINTENNGYFTDASFMFLPILVVFAWIFRFRWWALLPLLIGIGMRAATGSRWPFVMAFFSLCLFYMYDRKKKWLTLSMIGGAIAINFLFAAIGHDRGESARAILFGTQTSSAQNDTSSNFRPLESMDYANMEFFEFLVETIPKKTGTYNYFLNNLQVFTEPIPRVLWPDKPVGAPIKLYSLFDFGYPIGMTNSVPGEGWAQLGWLGIVIWSGLFGYMFGRIYTGFVKARKTHVMVALYIIFIPFSIQIFRDGYIVTMLKMSLFTLLPVLIWAFFINQMRRNRSALA